MKITFAITACNEHSQLKILIDSLLYMLKTWGGGQCEIIVQTDEANTSTEVRELLNEYSFHKQITDWFQFPLNNDFAAYKNNLSTRASGDWIFQLDADEMPHHDLVEALPHILSADDVPDVIVVPRLNVVKGITADHINEWGWRVSVIQDDDLITTEPISEISPEYSKILNTYGAVITKTDEDVQFHVPLINFPDYQWRLYRNKPTIRWVNKVHEKLSGHDNYGILPAEVSWCLYHVKDIMRQEKQNAFYSSL